MLIINFESGLVGLVCSIAIGITLIPIAVDLVGRAGARSVRRRCLRGERVTLHTSDSLVGIIVPQIGWAAPKGTKVALVAALVSMLVGSLLFDFGRNGKTVWHTFRTEVAETAMLGAKGKGISLEQAVDYAEACANVRDGRLYFKDALLTDRGVKCTGIETTTQNNERSVFYAKREAIWPTVGYEFMCVSHRTAGRRFNHKRQACGLYDGRNRSLVGAGQFENRKPIYRRLDEIEVADKGEAQKVLSAISKGAGSAVPGKAFAAVRLAPATWYYRSERNITEVTSLGLSDLAIVAGAALVSMIIFCVSCIADRGSAGHVIYTPWGHRSLLSLAYREIAGDGLCNQVAGPEYQLGIRTNQSGKLHYGVLRESDVTCVPTGAIGHSDVQGS